MPQSPIMSSEGGYYPASAAPYGGSGSEHSSSGYGPGAASLGAAGVAAAAGGVGSMAAYNRRSAKEMEAFGSRAGSQPHVTNPDEQRQAYLQYGPGPWAGQQAGEGSGAGMSMPEPRPGMPTANSGVVVHQDGGRVPVGKGREEEEDPAHLPEIPPTYDSLRPDNEQRQ